MGGKEIGRCEGRSKTETLPPHSKNSKSVLHKNRAPSITENFYHNWRRIPCNPEPAR